MLILRVEKVVFSSSRRLVSSVLISLVKSFFISLVIWSRSSLAVIAVVSDVWLVVWVAWGSTSPCWVHLVLVRESLGYSSGVNTSVRGMSVRIFFGKGDLFHLLSPLSPVEGVLGYSVRSFSA